MQCPHCKKRINARLLAAVFAAKGGKSTSEAKAEAARKNGRLGGRPKKEADASAAK